MVTGPSTVFENVNVHRATPRLTSARVQGEEPTVPEPAEPATVPVGVILVPDASVSLTVAVHVLVSPCSTGLGEQATAVEVGWAATVSDADPLLAVWPSLET